MPRDTDKIVEIAELKEVVGKLWKKVDEFQIDSKSETEHLSKNLSEWTQTNLFLLKLLADQAEEMERLSQNSTRLTEALRELKTPLNELRTLTKQPSNNLDSSLNQTLAKTIEELNQLLDQHQLPSQASYPHPNDSKKQDRKRVKIWNVELDLFNSALITGSYLLLTILNFWLGWQLRLWQIKSNPDFILGQELVEWNREQLEKARQDGQQKSTLWIVPPPEASANTKN